MYTDPENALDSIRAALAYAEQHGLDYSPETLSEVAEIVHNAGY